MAQRFALPDDLLAHVAGRIELVEGDIRDLATVQRCMRGVEKVFHLAARGSVPRSVDDPGPTNDINITGTLNLLAAAREAGARRFVYSASRLLSIQAVFSCTFSRCVSTSAVG